MSMIEYVAVINIPGYMPMHDEPAVFYTAAEAWEYLASERREAEDESFHLDVRGYSETLNQIEQASTGDADYTDESGCGTIYGSTPGYDGEHDLGLAYSVMVAE